MGGSVAGERAESQSRHCEELLRRSNPKSFRGETLDCFATLAMTEERDLVGWAKAHSAVPTIFLNGNRWWARFRRRSSSYDGQVALPALRHRARGEIPLNCRACCP
ncbi:hypothetical protein E4K66_14295 [Bradyrhizobium frederickii]|uniref:Uncharacterized protein n=1 Tax=Bradyrhizobium frederickii TaxID=2560054 RepID=A0A4Y9L4U6_9BRAD|nr:hypothetical protein E4K66_14295 [Bradyrhizobium frederickii]